MRNLVIAASIVSSVSCASFSEKIPMASAEADARAKEFVAPQSGGVVYIVRTNEHFWSAGAAIPVLVDDKHVGNIVQHTFFAVPLPPGIHRISTLVGKFEETATLDVLDGRSYFVESDAVPGAFSPRPIARRMPDEEGRSAVLDAKMASAK